MLSGNILVFIDQSKVDSFVKKIEYPYLLKNKYYYFSYFDYDKCAIVRIDLTPENREIIKIVTTPGSNIDKFFNTNSESLILKNIKKAASDSGYIGVNYIVYIPSGTVIANLSEGIEYQNFYTQRPPKLSADVKEFLAVEMDEKNDLRFCRIVNKQSIISILTFTSVADTLCKDDSALTEYGCNLVYILANRLHGESPDKDSFIKTTDFASPVGTKQSEYTLNISENLKAVLNGQKEETDPGDDEKDIIHLPPKKDSSNESIYNLSYVIEHGAPNCFRKLNIDVVLPMDIKTASSVILEGMTWIEFTTNNKELITKEYITELARDLGIVHNKCRIRFIAQ